MIEKNLYLLTALLGFVTIVLIGFRYKTNRHINLYLIVFLFLSSVRFLVHGLIDIEVFLQYQKQIDLLFFMSAWALLYLYFNAIVYNQSILYKKELVHFIVPSIIFILYCFRPLFTDDVYTRGGKIVFIIAIVLNIVYTIASFKLLLDNVWKRNSDILVINQQNKIIKQWTQLFFSLFTLMLIRFFINLAVNNGNYWYENKNNFLCVGALIWVAMYIKILYSPEFLYGYDVFQNKIKEYKKHNIIFDNVWTKATDIQVVNIQDTILKEKIATHIENYIVAIEYLALNTNLFFVEKFDTTNLAHKLTIPKSHVLYVFKYHAAISFSDFKKIIRIHKTVLLIDEGYLKTNTMESLATATGFSSYSSFFKSFKSITGVSPQEYIKN